MNLYPRPALCLPNTTNPNSSTCGTKQEAPRVHIDATDGTASSAPTVYQMHIRHGMRGWMLCFHWEERLTSWEQVRHVMLPTASMTFSRCNGPGPRPTSCSFIGRSVEMPPTANKTDAAKIYLTLNCKSRGLPLFYCCSPTLPQGIGSCKMSSTRVSGYGWRVV